MIASSPAGAPRLHSRYDPHGEAARYAATLALDPSRIRFVILIEPGAGYLAPPLRAALPGARVLALHAAPGGPPYADGCRPDASWRPGGAPLAEFLAREIPDTEAAAIKVVEWRPALRVYGDAYVHLIEETAAFTRRADANARTARHFGGRWLRNFFRNLDMPRQALVPARCSCPVIVAAAGPSLEDVLPLIRAPGALVLAVSSAAPALHAAGIPPRLTLATDGGPWALLHLYECLRAKVGAAAAHPHSPLAAALTAALPSQCADEPALLLGDGSLWQAAALRGLGVPCLNLPQRGTVAATAIDLALWMTDGPVYIAGVDLACRDLRAHARPYAFDRLWDERATRLDPAYAQVFRRAAGLAAGGSHEVYAAWFRSRLAAYPGRLRSLGGNHPVFAAIAAPAVAPAPAAVYPVWRTVSLRPSARRAAESLLAALSDDRVAADLRALAPPGAALPAWLREAARGGRGGGGPLDAPLRQMPGLA